MKKCKKKFYNDPWDPDFYETGSTKPPKDHGELVAFLLVLVILLGGTCSALGIINLRLLQQMAQPSEDPGTVNVFETAPEESRTSHSGENEDSVTFPRLGLEGHTVSDFDRRFYELPRGFLVTSVADNACAEAAGIHSGDVIVCFGDRTITSQEDLAEALSQFPAGKSITVEFYRHQTGAQMRTDITLPEE